MIRQIIYTGLFLSASFNALSQDDVADRMLLYQRSYGGWPKHIHEVKLDYSKPLDASQQQEVLKQKDWIDGTIDNNATTKEIRYLFNAAKKTGNQAYRDAAIRGVQYLLKMQYANGGFPQFYPDTAIYRAQITYNDNAMVNALKVLQDVASDNSFDAALRAQCAKAVDKGVECMLNSQFVRNGQITVWCAQVDRHTLQPVKARAFELPSLSGAESVAIVEFLMSTPHPSARIQESVQAAVNWFNYTAITGKEYGWVSNGDKKDHVLIDNNASRVWARFYNLENDQPFVCGRDGIKKTDVMNIEAERRNGYAWYGPWAEKLVSKEYPEWKTKIQSTTLQSNN